MINIGFVAFDRIVAMRDYFQQFPFYLWLTLLSYYLGTEGYRNAHHRYPPWVEGGAGGRMCASLRGGH